MISMFKKNSFTESIQVTDTLTEIKVSLSRKEGIYDKVETEVVTGNRKDQWDYQKTCEKPA